MLKIGRAGTSFFLGAAILLVGLLLAAIALLLSAWTEFVLPQNAISVLNLLVDVIVGILTVWALFWAASEFAQGRVEPELHFSITQRGDEMVLRSKLPNPEDLIWHSSVDSHPQVGIDLWVENCSLRPASCLRVVLNIAVSDDPKIFPADDPTRMEVAEPCLWGDVPVIHGKKPNVKHIQWGPDLIVYQGYSPCLGGFDLIFPDGIKFKYIRFTYTLHSLEGGTTKSQPIVHKIKPWVD